MASLTTEAAGLKYHELKINVKKPDERNWAYINYLHTKHLIVLPALGIEEDTQVLDQMKQHFPSYAAEKKIEQVDVSKLVKEGGVLNCMTWTIYA